MKIPDDAIVAEWTVSLPNDPAAAVGEITKSLHSSLEEIMTDWDIEDDPLPHFTRPVSDPKRNIFFWKLKLADKTYQLCTEPTTLTPETCHKHRLSHQAKCPLCISEKKSPR